jgi:hypothetical protein
LLHNVFIGYLELDFPGINLRRLATVLMVLIISSFMFSIVSTASISSGVYRIDTKAVSRFNGRPSWLGPKKNEEEVPTVSIAYPSDGDTLLAGIYAIDVKATGEEITVKIIVDGDVTDITNEKSGDYYVYYPWDVTSLGEYTITAEVTDKNDNVVTDSISVNVVESVEVSYEIIIEIDYIEGHYPTQEALDYIEAYYSAREINVAFTISDLIPNTYGSISDTEFWALEAKYNDGNDNSDDGIDFDGVDGDYEYTLKEKWVLFGTSVEGSPSTIGYCYIKIENKDLVAGNYIFIADSQVDTMGEEVTVLMHELGHSIGIAKVRVRGRRISEIYDENPFSVMSYMSTDNAGLIDAWHYSSQYWDTKDVDYYLKP